MSWKTYTTAEADSLLGGSEMGVIESHLGADEREKILAPIIERIRGAAGKCGAVGAAGTIPSEALNALRDLYRWNLLAALPVEDLQTKAREMLFKSAERWLERLENGDVAIERPEEAAASGDELSGQKNAGAAIFAGERKFDGAGLDGM